MYHNLEIILIYFTKVTKDLKNKYKSLKGKNSKSAIERFILRKLCSLHTERRLNSSLIPAYQITNKQNLFIG